MILGIVFVKFNKIMLNEVIIITLDPLNRSISGNTMVDSYNELDYYYN